MTTEAQREAYFAALKTLPEEARTAGAWLADRGDHGLTVDELEELFGTELTQSVRPVMTYLRKRGLAKDSGLTRPGSINGNKQTIWVVGEDLDIVQANRLRKLEKYTPEELADALLAKGWFASDFLKHMREQSE